MASNLFKFFVLFFLSTLALNAKAVELKTHKIEVLVNDKMITNYDIIQRIKINAIITQTNLDQDNYNKIYAAVVDELIKENLKKNKIDEYDISYSNEEYNQKELRFLSSYQIDKGVLMSLFDQNNVLYKDFKEFLVTELKWQKLIYGLYLRVTSVTDIEIEEIIKSNQRLTAAEAEEIIIQKQLELKSNKLLKDMQNEATIEYKK